MKPENPCDFEGEAQQRTLSNFAEPIHKSTHTEKAEPFTTNPTQLKVK